MKTAIELSDELSRPVRVNGLCLEAAAMLRQQAEQLSVWLAANGPGGWIDDLRNKCEALEITNDALKADAKRFMTLAEYLVSDRTECDDAIVDARTVEQLRAAIDAMKGKS